jgi:hypothetical protein
MGMLCVECTGEGVVLVDPVGEPVHEASPAETVTRATPPAPPEPTVAELLLDDDTRDTF